MQMVCDDDDPLLKYRSKFQKYNSFPEEVTVKLVTRGNNFEKKEDLTLSSHFFYHYLN